MELTIRTIKQADYLPSVKFHFSENSYVALHNDKVVAFIKCFITELNGKPCIDIAHLEVVAKRQGYGRATIYALCEHFNITTIKGYSLTSARGFWSNLDAKELNTGNPFSEYSLSGEFYISQT